MSGPIRVAIVDDDAFLRDALENLMRSAGFTVRLFSSAEDFLGRSADVIVDVFLTDYDLPGIDGIQTINRLRSEGDLTPAIVMSGHDSETLRGRALAGGATAFLTKPFDAEVLIGLIEACASNRRSHSNGAG